MQYTQIRRWIAHSIVPGQRYPLLIMGHFICIHSGQWADVALPNGFITVRWRRNNRYVYFSTDGTPSRAKWFWGRFND